MLRDAADDILFDCSLIVEKMNIGISKEKVERKLKFMYINNEVNISVNCNDSFKVSLHCKQCLLGGQCFVFTELPVEVTYISIIKLQASSNSL